MQARKQAKYTTSECATIAANARAKSLSKPRRKEIAGIASHARHCGKRHDPLACNAKRKAAREGQPRRRSANGNGKAAK